MPNNGIEITSERVLRKVVIELLINRIGRAFAESKFTKGEKIFNKLKKFDKVMSGETPEIRIFFLGLNQQTKKLHWLFLNDYYLTTKRGDILKLLLAKIPDIIDPTNYFEVPEEAIPYQEDEIRKYVVKTSESETDDKYFDNKAIGLAMQAYKENKAKYSPFSVLDPRSYKPSEFDMQLGMESTIYLPIPDPEERDKAFGVIVISWNYRKNTEGFFKTPDMGIDEISNLSHLLSPDDKWILYKHLTEDIAKPVEQALDKLWKNIKIKLTDGTEILKALFRTHIGKYMDYLTNFNMFMIDENIRITSGNPYLKKLFDSEKLSNLHSLETDPVKYVEDFIERNKAEFPAISHLKSLQDLEPLFASLGKKEHFIHMFNCFLFMNTLADRFVPEFEADEQHARELTNVALSHDIGYPIELLEEEITTFLERFFHKNKSPRFLIGKELLYSYGNFLDYYRLLREGIKDVFDGDDDSVTIFEDILIYNFHKRTDHALVSALFTMHFMDAETLPERERTLTKVGTAIVLHNFYQWKYHYLDELEDIKTDDCVIESDDGSSLQIKIGYNLFVHLWDKRFSRIDKKEKLKSDFSTYKEKCSRLKIIFNKISFDTDKNTIKAYSLFLSLADFFQEWGRLLYVDKGPASIGILVSKINDVGEKKRFTIKTPYVAPNQTIKTTDINDFSKWTCQNPRCEWEDFKEGKKFNFKEVFSKLLSNAKNHTRVEAATVHPYSQALLLLTAYKIWEFKNKFLNALDVTELLEIEFENAQLIEGRTDTIVIMP